jgi:hypothetical protein
MIGGTGHSGHRHDSDRAPLVPLRSPQKWPISGIFAARHHQKRLFGQRYSLFRGTVRVQAPRGVQIPPPPLGPSSGRVRFVRAQEDGRSAQV